jgi:hypothetical protein
MEIQTRISSFFNRLYSDGTVGGNFSGSDSRMEPTNITLHLSTTGDPLIDVNLIGLGHRLHPNVEM